jgi:hypothetical protein
MARNSAVTSEKAQIQSLIDEIDEVLRTSKPRFPWGRSKATSQQRRILEDTRSYLSSLKQQLLEDQLGRSERGSLSGALKTNDSIESAQQVLQAVLQEMNYLRVNMLQPMRSEVESLQHQRQMLLQEIHQLQTQKQQSLSGQAVSQQFLVEFLQSAMGQLQQTLTHQVQQLMLQFAGQAQQQNLPGGHLPNLPAANSAMQISPPDPRLMQQQSDQLMMRLDSTLRIIFESLQKNIQSYQDSLEQGLHRMHGLGQQGEAMFSTMVNRLAEQMGREASAYLQASAPSQPAANSSSIAPSKSAPSKSAPSKSAPLSFDGFTDELPEKALGDVEIDDLLDELNSMDAKRADVQSNVQSNVQSKAQSNIQSVPPSGGSSRQVSGQTFERSPNSTSYTDNSDWQPLDLPQSDLAAFNRLSQSRLANDPPNDPPAASAEQMLLDGNFQAEFLDGDDFLLSAEEVRQLQADEALLDLSPSIAPDDQLESTLDRLTHLSAQEEFPEEERPEAEFPEETLLDETASDIAPSPVSEPLSEAIATDDLDPSIADEFYQDLFGQAGDVNSDAVTEIEPENPFDQDQAFDQSWIELSTDEVLGDEILGNEWSESTILQGEAQQTEINPLLEEGLFSGMTDPADELDQLTGESMADLVAEELVEVDSLEAIDLFPSATDPQSVETFLMTETSVAEAVEEAVEEADLPAFTDTEEDLLESDRFELAAPDEFLISQQDTELEPAFDFDFGDDTLEQLQGDLTQLESPDDLTSFDLSFGDSFNTLGAAPLKSPENQAPENQAPENPLAESSASSSARSLNVSPENQADHPADQSSEASLDGTIPEDGLEDWFSGIDESAGDNFANADLALAFSEPSASSTPTASVADLLFTSEDTDTDTNTGSSPDMADDLFASVTSPSIASQPITPDQPIASEAEMDFFATDWESDRSPSLNELNNDLDETELITPTNLFDDPSDHQIDDQTDEGSSVGVATGQQSERDASEVTVDDLEDMFGDSHDPFADATEETSLDSWDDSPDRPEDDARSGQADPEFKGFGKSRKKKASKIRQDAGRGFAKDSES